MLFYDNNSNIISKLNFLIVKIRYRMKAKIIILILIFSVITSIFGQVKPVEKIIILEPQMVTPLRTAIFVEISNLEAAETTLNIYSKYLDTPGYFDNIINLINFVKTKVNQDIFKNDFLRTSGVETNRSIYLSYVLEKDNKNNNIIFIPVINEKEFPLLFIKILKSMKKNDNLDLVPAASPYKNFIINQLLKDIFYTTIDGYFILTSSGELIKEIIDIKTGPVSPAALSGDPLYTHYLTKKESSFPINVFIKGKSLTSINFNDLIPDDFDNVEGDNKNPQNDSAQKAENAEKKQPAPKRSGKYDFIDYLGFGLKNGIEKLNIKIYLQLDKNRTLSNLAAVTFTTGYADKTLFVPDPIAYCFVSADFRALSEAINKPENKNNIILPMAYGKINYYLKSNLGIDMQSEFTPYFGNLFNMVVLKSKRRKRYDNFIIYFPIVNSDDNKELYRKISGSIKKQYNKPGTFGETQIEGLDTFWFADSMGIKNYFFIFDNKFFMINDAELIKYFKQEPGKNLFEVNKEFSETVGKDTFILAHIKFDKETLTKMLVGMMLINIDPGMGPMIDKIDTLTLIGSKIENFYNFNINIKLLPDNK